MLFDLIEKRQSVRKYTDKAVEKEKIIKCLKAAQLAPSACNAQPWKFLVVENKELSNEVAKATYGPLMKFNKFAIDAPVMVVVLIEKQNFTAKFGATVKDIDYKLIDLGITTQHFCLQAHELGLGTCMIGWFDEKKIKKILNLDKSKKIGLVISLGYAPDDYKQRQKQRKDFEQMCEFIS